MCTQSAFSLLLLFTRYDWQKKKIKKGKQKGKSNAALKIYILNLVQITQIFFFFTVLTLQRVTQNPAWSAVSGLVFVHMSQAISRTSKNPTASYC